MQPLIVVTLSVSAEQAGRLQALQTAFAQVCNALAPLVQKTRCWNRVTLHHLAYKGLRQQFPTIGSQMICNAIFSVSRTARLVFQHPASPFNLARLGDKALPLLRFSDTSPVYFDRHTLSLKSGVLSMYTLDGRMRFGLALTAEQEMDFHEKKLREVVLSRGTEGVFELRFWFVESQEEGMAAVAAPQLNAGIPAYVEVESAA
jgi:hypothetical protein